jgi:uncharacterized phosphosugar-binding protein
MDQYFEALDNLIKTIKSSQRKNIEAAAAVIADAVEAGGAVHVYDTGHIINSELINRAGGLALMKQLRYTFTVDNPVKIRGKGINTAQEGIGKIILNASNVMSGDVLILGSVSGKNKVLVDLAYAAKDMGVKLIVVTSVAYSSTVKSEHSSGKRIFELGEIVIDNCAPVGDAMVDVDQLPVKAFPASGVSAAILMWAMTAEIIEKLIQKGIIPSVYRSVNFENGFEYLHQVEKRYQENGY